MRRFKTFVVLFQLIAVSFSFAENTEAEKIKYLLDEIEKSGAVFIRNNGMYPSTEARRHLELKMKNAGGRIKTASQFIEHVASKSSFSGEAYFIRMKNGREYKVADWLREKLADYEKLQSRLDIKK
ncbi:MAG: DUF5329 domain-containing protein [Spirochaetes bacterium]|jgi:hypothetical protein|nr:DUF5329 domain-containing protein [Spirochaetota bacterium]